jgi:hypothetical protein
MMKIKVGSNTPQPAWPAPVGLPDNGPAIAPRKRQIFNNLYCS